MTQIRDREVIVILRTYLLWEVIPMFIGSYGNCVTFLRCWTIAFVGISSTIREFF